MMNRLQELENIRADYEFQRKTLKLFKLNVKLALGGTVGLSGSLLKQSGLSGFTSAIAKERADTVEKHLADSTILSMWIVFERCLTEYLQNSVIVKSPSNSVSKTLSEKLQYDIERWKEDDKIEIAKSLLNSGSEPDMAGRLKSVKKYRDWVAHKNPKASPDNIKPENAYNYFKEAIRLLGNP